MNAQHHYRTIKPKTQFPTDIRTFMVYITFPTHIYFKAAFYLKFEELIMNTDLCHTRYQQVSMLPPTDFDAHGSSYWHEFTIEEGIP